MACQTEEGFDSCHCKTFLQSIPWGNSWFPRIGFIGQEWEESQFLFVESQTCGNVKEVGRKLGETKQGTMAVVEFYLLY